MSDCIEDFEKVYSNLEEYFDMITYPAIASDVEEYYLDIDDIQILKSSDSVNIKISVEN